jgi:hypothetical protein
VPDIRNMSAGINRVAATAQFLQAQADLEAAGLFHPSSLNYALNSRQADGMAARIAILPEGFGNPCAGSYFVQM